MLFTAKLSCYKVRFKIKMFWFLGAFCDLVWSDPEDIEKWTVSPRGAGWLFGSKVTEEFMEKNQLELICRAHQLVNEGKHFNTITVMLI